MTPSASRPESETPDVREFVASATAKIESIIDSAESVAAEIRDEASADADHYGRTRRAAVDSELEERHADYGRRLEAAALKAQELTEPLLAEVDFVRTAAKRLGGRLEEISSALRALADELAPGPGDTRAQEAPGPAGEDDSSEAEEQPEPVAIESPAQSLPPSVSLSGGKSDLPRQSQRETREASSESPPTEALLLATQLAVSGSSREQIEAELRQRFEIENVNAVLDELLGPEQPAGAGTFPSAD